MTLFTKAIVLIFAITCAIIITAYAMPIGHFGWNIGWAIIRPAEVEETKDPWITVKPGRF